MSDEKKNMSLSDALVVSIKRLGAMFQQRASKPITHNELVETMHETTKHLGRLGDVGPSFVRWAERQQRLARSRTYQYQIRDHLREQQSPSPQQQQPPPRSSRRRRY